MKISTFKSQSHLSESIIDAVIDQMGGKQSFKESARDVANYGIDGGFSGFIYHSDTVAFTDANRGAILDLAEQMAQELGESGSLELIAGFNCLRGEYTQSEIASAIYESDDENETTIKNALAWFVAEEVCRSYSDLQEAEA